MATHEELAAIIEQSTETDGAHDTSVPRLALFRATNPSAPIHMVSKPAFCVIARGRKLVQLGERKFSYDPSTFLVVSVDVPTVSCVTEASAEEPYLSLRLELDPGLISALMLETGLAPARADAQSSPSLMLSKASPEMLDACVRLVKLARSPAEAGVLAPLAEKEILYRLLTSEQGARLKQIAQSDSKLAQVQRAIHWIKTNYAEPFSVDAVAGEARMSVSALHLHFKAVTAMSPLQFQKQLRLQEARRLILFQSVDAAQAAMRVGYESPSQFSREYKRLFGDSPLRDVARLREISEASRAAAA